MSGIRCARSCPNERYQVFDRDTQVQVELFREENVPLETEEAKLGQQYQKLTGSLTVQFRGEEKTLIANGPLSGRARPPPAPGGVGTGRQPAAAGGRRSSRKSSSSSSSCASKSPGMPAYANYRDYAFRKLGRFDYTPADCVAFHQAVEQEVMPVVRELQAERQAAARRRARCGPGIWRWTR